MALEHRVTARAPTGAAVELGMPFQSKHAGEHLVADRAGLCVAGVVPRLVPREVPLRGEPLVANVAVEQFFLGVCPAVARQLNGPRELLAADLTSEFVLWGVFHVRAKV